VWMGWLGTYIIAGGEDRVCFQLVQISNSVWSASQLLSASTNNIQNIGSFALLVRP